MWQKHICGLKDAAPKQIASQPMHTEPAQMLQILQRYSIVPWRSSVRKTSVLACFISPSGNWDANFSVSISNPSRVAFFDHFPSDFLLQIYRFVVQDMLRTPLPTFCTCAQPWRRRAFDQHAVAHVHKAIDAPHSTPQALMWSVVVVDCRNCIGM